MKWVCVVILFILGMNACTSIDKDLLKQAEFLVESNPDMALKYLDSIKDRSQLNLEQTANYQLLR